MDTNTKNSLRLGVFVASGLLLFILGIYYLGQKQSLFQSDIIVFAEFKDVKGLQNGNNVRFLGIDIGSVTNISIQSDSTVRVEMGIDNEVRGFIRKNSLVEIDNEGVMGSKIITIHAGTTNANMIEENDLLQSVTSVSIEEILKEAQRTIESTRLVASNLAEITDKINSGKGDLGKFINDNSLKHNFDVLSQNLVDLSTEAGEIVKKANSGDNDLSILLNKKTITTQLSEILNNADSTSVNFKMASDELLLTTESINNGKGIIQKLLNDSAFASEIDTVLVNVDYGIDQVVETANAVKKSWIVNVFSKDKNRTDKKHN